MVRVLVIEDEATVLKNIARSLTRAGFEVLTAMTCESARNIFEGGKFDAICLDIGLPDGNGLDLLEELRRTASGLPVIVITSVMKPETRARAAALNVYQILPKPFSLASLKEALEASLISA